MRGLLVYPIRSDFEPIRGLVNKMEYQRAGFAELVERADLVCNSLRAPIYNGGELSRYLGGPSRVARVVHHYGTFFLKIVREIPIETYDFFYIRFPGSSPMFVGFLAELRRRNRRAKIVLEVPTYPFKAEAKTFSQKLILASNELTQPLLKRYVDFIVTFFGQRSIYGIDCVATSNGVDVTRLPVNSRRERSGGLRLLGVANLAEWHGYDRVIRGLAEEGSAKSVEFDIVGDGPERRALETLASSLGVVDRVHFHGVKTGAALDAMFSACDLAVGSLGMHRLALGTASSLKTREYCARGIPFVLGNPDADFPEGWPFAFRIVSDESPLNVGALTEAFGAMSEAYPDYPLRMRRYSEERLTWAGKLRPVVDRIRSELGSLGEDARSGATSNGAGQGHAGFHGTEPSSGHL